jgi:hypothetical protein
VNVYGNTRLLHYFVFLLCFSVLLLNCGKKGPPRPPDRRDPPTVTDLQHGIQKTRVDLSWTVPKKEKRLQSDLDGFRVYRSKLALSEADCENCPLQFTMVRDIAMLDKKKDDRITFSETLEPGYSYTYLVKGYSDNGMVSGDSNLVEFVFP